MGLDPSLLCACVYVYVYVYVYGVCVGGGGPTSFPPFVILGPDWAQPNHGGGGYAKKGSARGGGGQKPRPRRQFLCV